jgi:hypothetical protein
MVDLRERTPYSDLYQISTPDLTRTINNVIDLRQTGLIISYTNIHSVNYPPIHFAVVSPDKTSCESMNRES